MNSQSYLVNTSRGEIVDENAIVNAIKMKRLSGYACDVITGEHTVPIGETHWSNFQRPLEMYIYRRISVDVL